ncbi:histidine/lysine/arginine/ornithine transporter subunit; membrane component of ABC superfamily [Paraburkholderia piptadeniae]|uniref:Histidine/lysine/arginine/ornithine transport system permease protein HisM n=2 Tax=Paraburkholderia TaxID=1822464 RepID=A0A7X1NC08_9BURK|nr:ABC transporter permease subunit [Paraburkholderia franconis]SIT52012.1 histidine/lysine/arginine/ornithine transporter subunit; membrane component of ABC superfamily [Paraburkholderia piptadeniae]
MIDLLRQYWLPLLVFDGDHFSGLVVTLWLLVLSVAFGFVLAVPLSIARNSSNRYVSGTVKAYTFAIRGTPLYVQLLLIYTGIYGLEFVKASDMLSAFFRSGMNCTVLAFSLSTSAYTTEIFAGAMRAIPRGEIEAARAFGMSSGAIYRVVIIPAMLRRALPMYSNEIILMLHATTLAFTATVPELMKVVRDMNSATYMTFSSFTIAALIYLSISFLLIGAFKKAEKKWLAFLAPRSTGAGRVTNCLSTRRSQRFMGHFLTLLPIKWPLKHLRRDSE